MFNKLKKFLRSKKAIGSIVTAIKVGTAAVLGTAILVGGISLTNGVVIPSTEVKTQSVADYSGSAGNNVEGVTPVDVPAQDEGIQYTMLEGNGQVSTDSATGAARFRSEADYSKFTGVLVDGQEVSPSNYTSASGSTIVKLNPDYVSSLSEGQHTLSILSEDGKADSTFSVRNIAQKYGNRLLMVNRVFLIKHGYISESDNIVYQWFKCEENGDVPVDSPEEHGHYLSKSNGYPYVGTYYYQFTTPSGELFTSSKVVCD